MKNGRTKDNEGEEMKEERVAGYDGRKILVIKIEETPLQSAISSYLPVFPFHSQVDELRRSSPIWCNNHSIRCETI